MSVWRREDKSFIFQKDAVQTMGEISFFSAPSLSLSLSFSSSRLHREQIARPRQRQDSQRTAAWTAVQRDSGRNFAGIMVKWDRYRRCGIFDEGTAQERVKARFLVRKVLHGRDYISMPIVRLCDVTMKMFA